VPQGGPKDLGVSIENWPAEIIFPGLGRAESMR